MAKRQQSLNSFFKPKEPKIFKDACEEVKTPATGKSDENRQVKGAWFTDFKWLSLENGRFFCKDCRERKKQNIFAKEGKATAKPKRDDLQKHNNSIDHREAVEESRALKPAMERATVNAYSHAKDSIIAEMRTVFVMAKENIASLKINSLLNLQVLNACPSLKHLTNEKSTTFSYSHHSSVQDMYTSLSSVVEESLKAQLDSAVWNFYSIQIDEGTGNSNESTLMIYIRFLLAEGEISNNFLSVVELESTNATSILQAIEDVLKKKELRFENMVGFSSDGASVMMGVHQGVATKLKEKVPFLVTNHCMAHRLQLLSEKAANEVPYLVKFIAILNQYAKALKFSPKLCRILEMSKHIHQEQARKIKQVFFTRWLTFSNSVQALSGCLGGIISCLISAADDKSAAGKAIFKGLIKQMASYKFIMTTFFLSDAVGILGLLVTVMQESAANYSNLKQHIDAAVVSIHSLLEHDGPFTKIGRSSFPKEPSESGRSTYKTHEVRDTPAQRKEFVSACQDFIKSVTCRLEASFPSNDIMQAFAIFDPSFASNLQPDEADGQLELLLSHYGKLEDGTLIADVDYHAHINADQARIEWVMLQNVLKEHEAGPERQRKNAFSFYKETLHPYKDAYPNICKLAAIGLVIPVTSVDCERGFSRYSSIKTDFRNNLTVSTMEKLMLLSLETPEV